MNDVKVIINLLGRKEPVELHLYTDHTDAQIQYLTDLLEGYRTFAPRKINLHRAVDCGEPYQSHTEITVEFDELIK